MYDEKVVNYFINPRNVGNIAEADGVDESRAPSTTARRRSSASLPTRRCQRGSTGGASPSRVPTPSMLVVSSLRSSTMLTRMPNS